MYTAVLSLVTVVRIRSMIGQAVVCQISLIIIMVAVMIINFRNYVLLVISQVMFLLIVQPKQTLVLKV